MPITKPVYRMLPIPARTRKTMARMMPLKMLNPMYSTEAARTAAQTRTQKLTLLQMPAPMPK